MTASPECIFCKIVAGEISCFKLYEDGLTLAFMDINPFNEGHALAIPKAHHKDLYSADPDAVSAAMKTAQKVARAVNAAFAPDGLNIVQANGPAAGQSVFHIHFHIFPRGAEDGAAMNWGLNPGNMEEVERNADKIRKAMD